LHFDGLARKDPGIWAFFRWLSKATPPATVFEASGFNFPDMGFLRFGFRNPGGMQAGSRWLSEATPPATLILIAWIMPLTVSDSNQSQLPLANSFPLGVTSAQ
jgi:hypothetical protein